VDNRFRFGYTSWKFDQPISNIKMTTLYMAPSFINLFSFIASDIALSTNLVDNQDAFGIILYSLGMLAPYIDFTFNFISGSDWTTIRNITSHETTIILNTIGAVLIAFGAYRLIYRMVKIYQ
jgi:hypothetical protein